MREYDVIIVGSGHAGCEAASAAAKLGAKTLLIGMNLDMIAWMPCNPAVGGPAKSHLVKEIDAMGGLMGLAADATYMQLKTLNSSRGAAVHSLRAQSDKYEYSAWMRGALQKISNLYFYQAMVTEVLVENEKIIGAKTSLGEEIKAKAVVITSGTFLQGKVFTGKQSREAGRASEPAAIGLTLNLQSYGLEFGRLKTGTPARIDARSVDFSGLEEHPGDTNPKFFSFLPNRPVLEQHSCYATRTTERTAEIIRENLMESPMYAGLIEGVGPRYCPSIEDKIVRFSDKPSHLLFLEPEGRNTNEIYLQGCSTSLPINVQWQIVQSLPGLERAEIIRPAYAVEYDFLRPIQFKHTLEAKVLPGLFAAGQLLGTSGYEEAASQGFVAGINAAKYALDQDPVIFERSGSYIGTLIDDLVIKEITEPYRMMTSRSEHRLHLRQDNADRRLTPKGRKIGLVDDYRWECFNNKMEGFELGLQKLKETKIKASNEVNAILEEFNQAILKSNTAITLAELLSRPGADFALVEKLLGHNFSEDIEFPLFELETELKYAGYVQRQDNQNDKFGALENKKIPEWFDYMKLQHISKEAREKLIKIKPQTIGQAVRIDGVRPADVQVLLISLAGS
ncbi:MAG: tRNA uridine-5-carboxymethylaminomethyl(34) synthesis enzyme MnmG [Candidatus Caenarcaniphilales bacterium]|nr:tRNA uridine-5-carboxymethylaminomethyl(34) synthesis enzyme MnmG [Candidatus Caenarcaniphilales bacterium]